MKKQQTRNERIPAHSPKYAGVRNTKTERQVKILRTLTALFVAYILTAATVYALKEFLR